MLEKAKLNPEVMKGSMARREQSHILRTPADCWWDNIFPSSMMVPVRSSREWTNLEKRLRKIARNYVSILLTIQLLFMIYLKAQPVAIISISNLRAW